MKNSFVLLTLIKLLAAFWGFHLRTMHNVARSLTFTSKEQKRFMREEEREMRRAFFSKYFRKFTFLTLEIKIFFNLFIYL